MTRYILLLLNCCTFEKLTESIQFVLPFLKKSQLFQNGQKSRENRKNMGMILLFLDKPLGRHDITPVYITYPPLIVTKTCFCSVTNQFIHKSYIHVSEKTKGEQSRAFLNGLKTDNLKDHTVKLTELCTAVNSEDSAFCTHFLKTYVLT